MELPAAGVVDLMYQAKETAMTTDVFIAGLIGLLVITLLVVYMSANKKLRGKDQPTDPQRRDRNDDGNDAS